MRLGKQITTGEIASQQRPVQVKNLAAGTDHAPTGGVFFPSLVQQFLVAQDLKLKKMPGQSAETDNGGNGEDEQADAIDVVTCLLLNATVLSLFWVVVP